MNNLKSYKKFIYILILLLIASCSQQLTESSVDNKNSGNEKDPAAKSDIAVDHKIFVISDDNKDNDGTDNIRKHATVTAVGDVILNWAQMGEIFDERVIKYGKKDAIGYPFARVKKEMVGIGFCNLEAPITNFEAKLYNDKDEAFYFKSPGGSEEILKQGGFNVVSLANNHIMDTGEEGMFDTYKRLEKKGIIPVGIGSNIDEALEPVYINDKDTVIAMFAFSAVIPRSVWAGPDKSGTAGGSSELLCAAVKKLSRNADAVFVSIHWGEEVATDLPVKEPGREQVELAHKLIDAGAACIVGHHSHAIGPVERYKDGVIFYSLGDFVFAGRHSASHATSIMAQVSLSRDGLESYTLIPVNINPLAVEYSPVILNENSGRKVIGRIFSDNEDIKYEDYYEKNRKTVSGTTPPSAGTPPERGIEKDPPVNIKNPPVKKK